MVPSEHVRGILERLLEFTRRSFQLSITYVNAGKPQKIQICSFPKYRVLPVESEDNAHRPAIEKLASPPISQQLEQRASMDKSPGLKRVEIAPFPEFFGGNIF